jgi:hypothetical protein
MRGETCYNNKGGTEGRSKRNESLKTVVFPFTIAFITVSRAEGSRLKKQSPFPYRQRCNDFNKKTLNRDIHDNTQ